MVFLFLFKASNIRIMYMELFFFQGDGPCHETCTIGDGRYCWAEGPDMCQAGEK